MIFERFYDPDLAQASFLIGSSATGEAVVVDARRDVGVYLEAAAAKELRIVAVTETHIHADYLSGSRELAAATGATLYLSGEGDADWQYRFEAERLHAGDVIRVGEVRLEALHTPGHTPEHLAFLVRAEHASTAGAEEMAPARAEDASPARAQRPSLVRAEEATPLLLSGDFVFVGDVGRPDLLDAAAGGVDTRFEGSKQLLASLRDVFLTLPDEVRVWPGHGAGSACGKALGDAPSTTVGSERLTAWWRGYVDRGDVDGFTRELLEGQVDAPSYFGRMKRQNRDGPALLGRREPPERLEPLAVAGKLDELILIDARSRESLGGGVVPGSLLIAGGGKFTTYASYVLDPEADPRPVVLVAGSAEVASGLRDRLARIGIDRVLGYLPSVEGFDLAPLPEVEPGELRERLERLERLGPDGSAPYVLDVRSNSEFEAGHIQGAHRLHAGRVLAELASLPQDRDIIVHCQTGARATVVASALRAKGMQRVRELRGSYVGWVDAGSRSKA